MKTKRTQRMMSFAVALMMALTMIISSTSGAIAASPYYVGAPAIMYQGQLDYSVDVYNINTNKTYTLTSVKSSKPGIVKVKKDSWPDEKGKKHTYYFISAKKAGKATITVKFKANGKVKTVKHKVTVKKYPKPIRSLKVNGKAIKLKSEKRYQCDVKCKATTATIKAALKKGWKIESVYGYYGNENNGKSKEIKDVKKLKKLIKNGSAISFPKKWTSLGVGINLNKGNDFINYHVYFYR